MAHHNITRFHWQTLNLIKETGHVNSKDSETMKLFLDKDQLDAVVEDLIQRSWVRAAEEDSSLILTEEGRKRFAEIPNTQDIVRKTVTKGTSQEEYIMITRILQKMVDNLRG